MNSLQLCFFIVRVNILSDAFEILMSEVVVIVLRLSLDFEDK